MPERIRLSRARGWRKPENTVVVSRPSRWGNPFGLGKPSGLAREPAINYPAKSWEYEGRVSAAGMRHDFFHPGGRVTVVNVRAMTPAEVVECYRAYVTGGGWPIDWTPTRAPSPDDIVRELAGRNLACWCPLDQPCHADVLLELANAESGGSGFESRGVYVRRPRLQWRRGLRCVRAPRSVAGRRGQEQRVRGPEPCLASQPVAGSRRDQVAARPFLPTPVGESIDPAPGDHMSSHDRAIADPPHTIVALTIPDRVDAPDADDFVGMATVKAAVEAEQRGTSPALTAAPTSIAAEMLPSWKDDAAPMRGFVAKVGARVVARATLALPVDAQECWAAVSVLPGFRGRGIGRGLHDRLERAARDAGRTTMQNQTSYAAGVGGAAVTAPTGFGSVPLSLASTRFLQRHGYALEQVGRLSTISLPLDPAVLAARVAETTESAAGYRTVTWQGRTPPERLDGIAHLRTRMSIDAPSAGIAQTEDVWTAARVVAVDDLWAGSPRTVLTTVAVDERTGRVVGFTELDVPAERDRPVEQMDTLVVAQHRGRRLGMLLKLTNLREVATRFPGHETVETMNAEDNRPMLDVNEAIGFAPVSHAARWRKPIA